MGKYRIISDDILCEHTDNYGNPINLALGEANRLMVA